MEQAKLLKRNNRKAQHDTQEVQHQYSRYREMYKYACISALDVMDASKAPVDVFRELSSIHKSDLTLVTSPAER